MSNCDASNDSPTLRHFCSTGVTALAVALASVMSQAAEAHGPEVPPVPSTIQVPAGHVPFLIRQAYGTQNYVCLPSTSTPSGFAWALFTPQATLFNRGDKQVMTHFFSPNPAESGTFRPTWQHSDDSSIVWAKPFPPSLDPNYVAPGALAWLLLEAKGAQEGPKGGDTLTQTTFVQRVNTAGGLAPSSGCSSLSEVGSAKYIPYAADYVFFRSMH
jgi:hypothetical protein